MSQVIQTGATKIKAKAAAESLLFSFDFTPLLPKTPGAQPPTLAATLTGTPTVIDAAGVLTIGGPIVNTGTYLGDEGQTVAIGAAVQARISGGAAGTSYNLTITATDTGGNTRVMGGATYPVVLQVT